MGPVSRTEIWIGLSLVKYLKKKLFKLNKRKATFEGPWWNTMMIVETSDLKKKCICANYSKKSKGLSVALTGWWTVVYDYNGEQIEEGTNLSYEEFPNVLVEMLLGAVVRVLGKSENWWCFMIISFKR